MAACKAAAADGTEGPRGVKGVKGGRGEAGGTGRFNGSGRGIYTGNVPAFFALAPFKALRPL